MRHLCKKKNFIVRRLITFLKTKLKFYGDEVTDFYEKEIPKLDSNHTCLAIISLNSALKMRIIMWKCF